MVDTAAPVTISDSTFSLFGVNFDDIKNAGSAIYDKGAEIITNAVATPELQRAAIGAMSTDAFITEVGKNLKGATPTPELATEADRFVQTLKDNPALAASIQSAMSKDPSMLEGFQNMAANANGAEELRLMNETLVNPDNRTLMTNVMNAIARNPDDNINFGFLQKVTDFGKKVAAGTATSDEYKAFNAELTGVGIEDDRIQLMADPSNMWKMFMEDPKRMVEIMMNQFGNNLSPDMQNLVAGLGTWVAEAMSAFVDPNGDFVGHYVGIGRDVVAAAKVTGAETLNSRDAEAAELAATGNTDFERTSSLGSNVTVGDNDNMRLADVSFNPNSFAERTDGYRDPAIPTPGAAPFIPERAVAAPSLTV